MSLTTHFVRYLSKNMVINNIYNYIGFYERNIHTFRFNENYYNSDRSNGLEIAK